MTDVQVKTRMQLETGKSQHGLVGTLRSIVREEGYVRRLRLPNTLLTTFKFRTVISRLVYLQLQLFYARIQDAIQA